MKLHGKEVSIWDGEFTVGVTRDYRISLCTTCMGRLHDLARTLPKNIDANRDYPRVEFIVLDYNSDDGLEDWMRRNMQEQIESGLVTYCRTTEPQYYSMSHSRNLAFLVASGDIVNNVDADNWVKAGFVSYLNRLANQCPRKAIFARRDRSIHGRLGFFKDEWEQLGGYDEQMDGWGFEEVDLCWRAWTKGFTLMWFGDDYCSGLGTSEAARVAHMRNKDAWQTARANKRRATRNFEQGRYLANHGRRWGVAKLVKNFTEEIEVGRMNS